MKNQSFRIRFGYAWNGIKSTVRGESSFRIQLTFAVLAVIAFLVLKANPIWWAILFSCIGSVLMAEMFNTALEHIIDHIHPEQHTAIGVAKDCAAGAVLISSLASVVIFVMFLIDRFALFSV